MFNITDISSMETCQVVWFITAPELLQMAGDLKILMLGS